MSRALRWILLCLIVQATTVFGIDFNVTLVSLTNHNTSAFAAYNQNNFSANFGPTSWVNQAGTTIPIDQTKVDSSLNPITPGHVSKTDVHTLIPNRPDLRWFAHATPWFGPSSHINIGLNNNTTAYVAAMITDMKNRGFNGVVINWYGKTHQTDNVALKVKAYLASIPGNTFTYIFMLDKGIIGSLGTSNLEYQIHYCQTNYFNDPNYEREPAASGNPILMFFGVRTVVGAAGMTTIKSDLGGNMVWVEQGTSYLSEAWEDESFQWTDDFSNGVNASDPFNLSAVTSQFTTLKNSGKKSFGAMCSQFNGTLTKSVNWSMGKYLPCSNGLCEVQRASVINAAIPANMTRMQWATWSDWEEGTQIETGIENNFGVTAQMNTNVLSWATASGDERTIDHYEIYASSNGVTAALMGSVKAGVHQTNLTQAGLSPGSYQFYVDAIGKPCIRDHLSQPVSAFFSSGPVIVDPPTSLSVAYGGTATFTVNVSGSQPLSYTWYDQNNIVVGTGSSLVIGNATQNNSYYVAITNQFGGLASAPAALTVITTPVVTADLQPLSQTVWQGETVSFAVTAGGVSPFTYQWTLNGQQIPGATSSTYAFNALPGTNSYQVTVSNAQGSTNSSIASVVGKPATFLNAANYYGMRITFSGYTNTETLREFPVLVRLSASVPGFSYAQFASPNDGADLRFAAENGRELPFEIEKWNPSGESLVWVQVPSIASTNDYITAHWGNPADSAMPSSNTNGAVWSTLSGSNDFALVYHMNQSSLPFVDSTLQYPATSGSAPALATGIVGNGSAFNGSSQFLDPGLVQVPKTFTVSAWVNIAPAATSEQTIWCNKQGGWNTAGFDFYVNSFQTADGKVYFDTSDGVGGNVAPRTAAGTVSFGQWHLLTGTLDGSNGVVHVYIDGIDQTVATGVDTAFQTTNYVRCSALLTGAPGTTGGLPFNGSMDETRIENSVRSPAWVWASWATVANSSFANFSSIAPPVVALNFQMSNGSMVLMWTTGMLQSASSVAGPYTDMPEAVSPYTVAPSDNQQFFRIKVQPLP
jgi:hypothetical protein